MFEKYIIIILLVFCKNTELFEEYYKEAEEIMSSMTMEQRVSQLIFPRFNDSMKDEDIKTRNPGGFIFFAYDFENKTADEIIKNMNYIQDLSMKTMKLPLGLGVDEEGGKVCRVSPYQRKEGNFSSPLQIYNESGIKGILKTDQEKRDLLRKFKLNVNLAPVADFTDDQNAYIYNRTLGRPLSETIDYISKDVQSYVNDNFTCCTKHFPGYGNNIDTHGDIAIDNRTYESFVDVDFKPFEAGIAQKIPMILVAHNIVTCKDDKYPASISKTWHDVLRNELKFSGLILTDDLSMEAIKKYSGELSPAILAVNAGNDVILTSDFDIHHQAVIEATENGTISNETINTACRRVIAWKLKYLMAQKEEPSSPVLIIVLSIVGLIIIVVVALLLAKFVFCKKKSDSDEVSGNLIDRETKDSIPLENK